MEQSLFEKYGGFATVHKVVEHFYDGVLDNDMLSPHFESPDALSPGERGFSNSGNSGRAARHAGDPKAKRIPKF